MEEWRDIDGFPGYQISNMGRAKGPRKENLKLVEESNGYLKITLSRNGKHTDKRINRLVAQEFLPNPDNFPIVMHIDNNRKNNNVENLAWGSYSENNQWMHTCGRHPLTLTDEDREKAYAARRSPVKAINVSTSEELFFDSQHDAARALGISQQHIWGVLNGYRKTSGGYRFEYTEKRGIRR